MMKLYSPFDSNIMTNIPLDGLFHSVTLCTEGGDKIDIRAKQSEDAVAFHGVLTLLKPELNQDQKMYSHSFTPNCKIFVFARSLSSFLSDISWPRALLKGKSR
jgi:hypothetical protein